MGNRLCRDGILSSNTQYSYVIEQAHYEESKKVLNEHLGSRGMDFLAKNNLPLWKMKAEEKYYCGRFLQGKGHGLGIIFIPNRSYYEGQLKYGLPDGQGYLKIFFKDDVYQIYSGQFSKGMANGMGHLECRHNKIYFQFQGQWQNASAKSGVIKPKFQSEVEYINVNNDTKTIKFKNGDVYQGSVNSYFEPNGVGKLIYNGKSAVQSYEGEWFRSKFNGNGICKWRDGSFYDGHYIDGQKQGEGKFVFASKNYYIGHWLDGYQHGMGCLYDKNGQIRQKGIWIKGKISLAMETTQEQNLKYQMLPTVPGTAMHFTHNPDDSL